MKKKEILKLENVGYRYNDAAKDEYVLKDLSYSFETGTIYAIKGKSGSGKTTLLSLISGLEKIILEIFIMMIKTLKNGFG